MIDNQQLQTILEFLPDPAFVITRSGFYAAAYGGRDDRYYHDGSPLVGLYVHEFMQKEQADWLVGVVTGALDSGRLEVVEYSLSGRDLDRLEGIGPSDVLWFEARIQSLPFKVGGEDAVLWVASNITERHSLEEGLKKLSNTDPLTGLYNRRRFEDLAGAEMSVKGVKARPLSILVADLDHFKSINDNYGHGVGDAALKGVADIIRQNLRRTDFAARWGGEEFVIALSDSTLEQSMLAGEWLRRAIAACNFDGGLQLTVSIGVTQRRVSDRSLHDIIERADTALYQAKHYGRNCVKVADCDLLPHQRAASEPAMPAVQRYESENDYAPRPAIASQRGA